MAGLQEWPIELREENGVLVVPTRALMGELADRYLALDHPESAAGSRAVADLAASFQANLARGIALAAVRVAEDRGIGKAALSGGVAINTAIRTTIVATLESRGLACLLNERYPLGDGCISLWPVRDGLGPVRMSRLSPRSSLGAPIPLP